MRIYNATDSQLTLPLVGTTQVIAAPKSVSGDFLPTNEFLSLVVSTFDEKEIALIPSGTTDSIMCANMPVTTPLVVQSIEAAIKRFGRSEEDEVKETLEDGSTKVYKKRGGKKAEKKEEEK